MSSIEIPETNTIEVIEIPDMVKKTIIEKTKKTNKLEKLKSTSNMCIEIFKILMSCMLSVFVPQDCGDHICTIHDNFSSLTPFNYAVLIYNFMTLTLFIVTYYIELKREYWIIDHFDHNELLDESADNFIKMIEKYPKIRNKLFVINGRYNKFYKALYFFVVSNFILSVILTCGFYYNGSGTVTTLLTNLLLVVTKLKKGYETSETCVKEKRAISAYMYNYIVYNDIDAVLHLDNHDEIIAQIKKESII